MASSNCALMVAKNGDLSVTIVVELDLLLNGKIRVLKIL
jgi:hypothetical protein